MSPMCITGVGQSSLQVRGSSRSDVSCAVGSLRRNFVAIIITDQEYPVRPAFSLLTKLLEDFTAKVPQRSFSTPSAISFPEINTYLEKYQDPRQADTIMRVQQELDETKIVLVRASIVWHDFGLVLTDHGVIA